MVHWHRPKALSEIAGNGPAVASALAWALSWESGAPRPPIIICGPTGVGKTAVAHAISSQFGWELFEFNASDLRDEDSVERLVGNAVSSGSLFGGRRLILIDDADSLSGSSDRGGASSIVKAISKASQPVVITAQDIHDKKLSAIKRLCEVIQMRRPMPSTISNFLRITSKRLGAEITKEQADSLSANSAGDVRAALNDLFAANFSASRDRKKGVFEAVRQIFKSETYSEARKAPFSSEADHDLLKMWVCHNVPFEYEKPFEIAEAYQALSRADMFDGRTRRLQYFGFLRYSGDLLSSGVALAKDKRYSKFSPYSFPEYIGRLGATKSGRAARLSVLRKISSTCHCSIWAANDYLSHVRGGLSKSLLEISAAYGFSEDDLAFLSGVPNPKKGKSGGV